MKQGLAAAVQTLRRVLDAAAALLLTAVLVVTAARVLGRYVFGLALPWSEELVRLLFMWLVMLGAARASHMHIDLLPRALPPALARGLRVLIAAVSLGLLGLLVYHGMALVELTARDRYTALGVSVQYLYWSLVIGGALWMVTLIATLVSDTDEPTPPAS